MTKQTNRKGKAKGKGNNKGASEKQPKKKTAVHSFFGKAKQFTDGDGVTAARGQGGGNYWRDLFPLLMKHAESSEHFQFKKPSSFSELQEGTKCDLEATRRVKGPSFLPDIDLSPLKREMYAALGPKLHITELN